MNSSNSVRVAASSASVGAAVDHPRGCLVEVRHDAVEGAVVDGFRLASFKPL
jgi:hypothetical protein